MSGKNRRQRCYTIIEWLTSPDVSPCALDPPHTHTHKTKQQTTKQRQNAAETIHSLIVRGRVWDDILHAGRNVPRQGRVPELRRLGWPHCRHPLRYQLPHWRGMMAPLALPLTRFRALLVLYRPARAVCCVLPPSRPCASDAKSVLVSDGISNFRRYISASVRSSGDRHRLSRPKGRPKGRQPLGHLWQPSSDSTVSLATSALPRFSGPAGRGGRGRDSKCWQESARTRIGLSVLIKSLTRI